MKPLTQLELSMMAAGGCSTPGCTHNHDVLYLHSRCHPEAGVSVSYERGSGLLLIECANCDLPIAEIRVAKP